MSGRMDAPGSRREALQWRLGWEEEEAEHHTTTYLRLESLAGALTSPRQEGGLGLPGLPCLPDP